MEVLLRKRFFNGFFTGADRSRPRSSAPRTWRHGFTRLGTIRAGKGVSSALLSPARTSVTRSFSAAFPASNLRGDRVGRFPLIGCGKKLILGVQGRVRGCDGVHGLRCKPLSRAHSCHRILAPLTAARLSAPPHCAPPVAPLPSGPLLGRPACPALPPCPRVNQRATDVRAPRALVRLALRCGCGLQGPPAVQCCFISSVLTTRSQSGAGARRVPPGHRGLVPQDGGRPPKLWHWRSRPARCKSWTVSAGPGWRLARCQC